MSQRIDRSAMRMSGESEIRRYVLENDLLRVEFNEAGDITRVYDKAAGREVLALEDSAPGVGAGTPGQGNSGGNSGGADLGHGLGDIGKILRKEIAVEHIVVAIVVLKVGLALPGKGGGEMDFLKPQGLVGLFRIKKIGLIALGGNGAVPGRGEPPRVGEHAAATTKPFSRSRADPPPIGPPAITSRA